METWKSGITDINEDVIHIRGYDVTDLMQNADFVEVIFLMHQARLPSKGERRLLNALLVASSDHGPKSPSSAAARIVASGNRASFEAAVAAGILAIGDAHGGAGQACMEMIISGLDLREKENLTIDECAKRVVADFILEKKRLPGIGHTIHKRDPRVEVIFKMAESEGLAGDGIIFLQKVERISSEEIHPLPINIDGALAAVLFDLGFPPVMAKAIFISGRVVGLSAHVHEELLREKPMRFQPPVEYDGPTLRKTLKS